jgi:YHS domain-containing protein
MELKPGQEEASLNYQGHGYHFCSVECRLDFQKDPKRYVAETDEAPARQN